MTWSTSGGRGGREGGKDQGEPFGLYGRVFPAENGGVASLQDIVGSYLVALLGWGGFCFLVGALLWSLGPLGSRMICVYQRCREFMLIYQGRKVLVL